MTSRERINDALNHQEPDRTPIFEYVLLSPNADALLGRTYAADPANWPVLVRERGWEGAVRQMALDQLELACLLGHDMLYVPLNPAPPGAAAAPEPPAQTDDPVESLRRRNERAAQLPSVPPDECFLVFDFLRRAMRERDVDLPVLAPAYAHGVWTDVDLMQTMLLAPEVAKEHFALATRRALGHVERYIALGVDLIGIGGDFAGNRLLISPGAYREFIVPEVRAVSRRVHEAGLRAVNASDGDLWPVIEDFLFGCGADGYIEIDFQAGMDLGRLKRLYGERVTFFGNLECGNILSFGSPEDVRRHTAECIEAGRGGGGHVLCASNAITASVPLRNYLSVVEAYRGFFELPPLRL
jgi:uroporphyrinogen decarboxylase